MWKTEISEIYVYVIDFTYVASKQLGPWPQPDITLFSRMYE